MDMRSRCRIVGYWLALAVGAVGFGAQGAAAAPITLSNATTEVEVYGGEANNGLTNSGGYFRYTDLASGEETTWSIDPVFILANGAATVLSNGSAGGFGSPMDLGGGVVRSTTSVGIIAIQADTELIGTIARTTFTFTLTTAGSLSGHHLVFYAENDIVGFSSNVASFSGSIAGGNLVLNQTQTATGGLNVRLTGAPLSGAALTAFGSGVFSGFGSAIAASNLTVLSNDGSNFVHGPADLGLALDFTLADGVSSATLVVDYSVAPAVAGAVGAPTMSVAALALVCVALMAAGTVGIRRRRAPFA